MHDIDRRTALRASGYGLAGGLITLAGCTGTSGDGGGDGGDGGGGSTPTSSSGTGTAAAAATVAVGPGGDLVFEPETVEVDVGSTVLWRWDSGGHTVTPTDVPEGASWEGTGEETHDSGFSIRHTFEVEGRYDYVCGPHESAGMIGAVLVGDASGGASTATPEPTTTESGGGYYEFG